MNEQITTTDEPDALPWKRFPIVLNSHAVAVLHVFTRHDCLEDLWMSECYHNLDVQDVAANQLVDQLGDMVSAGFLMALTRCRNSQTEGIRRAIRDIVCI